MILHRPGDELVCQADDATAGTSGVGQVAGGYFWIFEKILEEIKLLLENPDHLHYDEVFSQSVG
mgnify:CR=1 FL=1